MKIKIALWGAGGVAINFAKAIKQDNAFELVGVASRHYSHAKETAEKLDIVAYESYESLLDDNNLDYVYVSTPTRCHYEDMKRLIVAKKNVICEKPFTETYNECVDILKLARENKIIIIDGLWSMYMPLVDYIDNKSKEMGKLLFASASLGYPTVNKGKVPTSKYEIWDYEVYPVSIMIRLFGKPNFVKSKSKIIKKLVIGNKSYLKYDKGIARVHSSLLHRTSYCFFAIFSSGIIISRKWWFGNRRVLCWKYFKCPEIKRFSHRINGYEYEIDEAKNRFLMNSKRYMLEDNSMDIIQVLDLIKEN